MAENKSGWSIGSVRKAGEKPAVSPQKQHVPETSPEPEKTAAAPRVQTPSPEPEKTAAAPRVQTSSPDPEKTAAAPRVQTPSPDPEKTAAAPKADASAPEKTATAPGGPSKAVPAGNRPDFKTGDTLTVGNKKYKIASILGSGTEADLYELTDGKSSKALKVYHGGYGPNMTVIPLAKKLNGKMLIADIDFVGEVNGYPSEMMPLYKPGSAAAMDLKKDQKAILTIASMTALALSECHKAGFLHKDVKPANILVYDAEKYACVLCDLGIADPLKNGKAECRQDRTPMYAAPEVYDPDNTVNRDGYTWCLLTPAADYYSLGMSILSMWMGESAFRAQQTEIELAIQKKKGSINIPSDMPDPLYTITKGLLVRNPEKRWGYAEIVKFLSGETVEIEDDSDEIGQLNIVWSGSKNQVAHSLSDLAAFMREDPGLAKRYLYKGTLMEWLEDYPEMILALQDITETRYPKDQDRGLNAAMFVLDPDMPISLSGINYKTGAAERIEAHTPVEVRDFLSTHSADDATVDFINDESFVDWLTGKDNALVRAMPSTCGESAHGEYGYRIYMLRLLTMQPLSDPVGNCDPSSNEYAMTSDGLAKLLNKAYDIYWGMYRGDSKLLDDWDNPSHAPENLYLNSHLVKLLVESFNDGEAADGGFLMEFFSLKGNRFHSQIDALRETVKLWDGRNDNSKAGPKDDKFLLQASMMKYIKRLGADPWYTFRPSGKTFTDSEDKWDDLDASELKDSLHRGVQGWFAVNTMEDPTADHSEKFAYEEDLDVYLSYIATCNEDANEVVRYDRAVAEAKQIVSDGKKKIRSRVVRSTVQATTTILFALIPSLFLLGLIISAIIAHPVLDTTSLGGAIKVIAYILGGIAAVAWFALSDSDGCIVPIIVGVVAAVVLRLLVKFLAAYILYIYGVVVVAVIVFFLFETLFNKSPYAAAAKKFTKPGFEELTLEPLHFAWSKEKDFDSSLNGAFSNSDIDQWKNDQKRRSGGVWAFILVTWVLLAISAFLPKSNFGNNMAELLGVDKVVENINVKLGRISKDRAKEEKSAAKEEKTTPKTQAAPKTQPKPSSSSTKSSSNSTKASSTKTPAKKEAAPKANPEAPTEPVKKDDTPSITLEQLKNLKEQQ